MYGSAECQIHCQIKPENADCALKVFRGENWTSQYSFIFLCLYIQTSFYLKFLKCFMYFVHLINFMYSASKTPDVIIQKVCNTKKAIITTSLHCNRL